MLCHLLCIQLLIASVCNAVDVRQYRSKVLSMFYDSYDSYVSNAFPRDELRPISCDGHETFGSYSLTLVDSLDMLAIVGNSSEFKRAASVILDSIDIDRAINVSVFETNIRVVGGLLSAHLMAKRVGFSESPGWPCSGPLLDAAVAVARKLLPAFYTKTGMPYGTINFRDGVPKGETPITCVASIGTFLIEFGLLSRLTGDPEFERVAMRALYSLWDHRSAKTGLVGNHIDTHSGKWTATDATIGSAVDSYFEYLAKAGVMFNRPDLLFMFHEYENVINRYIRKGDWHVMVAMETGQVTWPYFQSLESFWPGVLTITGNLNDAIKIYNKYFEIWRQYGSLPEIYDLSAREVKSNRAAYPLRPELAESTYYLYRATKDPFYLEAAATMVDNIDRLAKTPCGYATMKDVGDHTLENRMESFWLAETLKYLYLVFDLDNFINANGATPISFDTPFGQCTVEAGGFVFNTEAHPMDPSAIYCCAKESQKDFSSVDAALENFDYVIETGLNIPVTDVSQSNIYADGYLQTGDIENYENFHSHAQLFESLRQPPARPIPPPQPARPARYTSPINTRFLGICTNPSQLTLFLQKVIRLESNKNKVCPALPPSHNRLLQQTQLHQKHLDSLGKKQPGEKSEGKNAIVEALQGWLSLLSGEVDEGDEKNGNVVKKNTGNEIPELTIVTPKSANDTKDEMHFDPPYVDPCAGEFGLAECYLSYEELYNRPAFVCQPVPYYVRHLGIHGVQFYDPV